MVPNITKTLNQVTPHQHPLVRAEIAITNSIDHDGFICSGCDTQGTPTGIIYRCKYKHCDFYLHEDCATCPNTLSTHIHPMHLLKLVWRFKDNLPCCDVCGDQVKGLYYTCPDATCNNFVLHPICSKFPSHVRHVIDSKHSLTFQLAVPSWCTICSDLCTSWRYRCGPCKINIHLECVTSAPSHHSEESNNREPKQQQQQYQPRVPNHPPPMQLQQHTHQHHYHQEKGTLPNYDYGYPMQQPPPPVQQWQHQHQHQEKSPPPNHDYGYRSPVHDQYNYGHHQHQHHQQQQQPPHFVPHPNKMYDQPQPAHPQGGGGDGCAGVTKSSGTTSGGKKRKMCLVVAKIVASLAVGAILGIPGISPFS